jgi:2C-methyl-D-erythritol 2,4-cyclodiphosphate synthase
VQSGLDSELIVLYHHAIADGISGAYLLGDIVRGLFESNFTRQELATAVSIEEAYGLSPEVHGVICAAFLCSLTNQQNPHRNSVASHPGMLDRSSRFLVKML